MFEKSKTKKPNQWAWAENGILKSISRPFSNKNRLSNFPFTFHFPPKKITPQYFGHKLAKCRQWWLNSTHVFFKHALDAADARALGFGSNRCVYARKSALL